MDVLEVFFAYWDLICLREKELFRDSCDPISSRWKSPTIEQLAVFCMRFEDTLSTSQPLSQERTYIKKLCKAACYSERTDGGEESITNAATHTMIQGVISCIKRAITMKDVATCILPPSPWIAKPLE
mmetsp:Transcript_23350/g.32654  ORF Transcript_23350/g.32654 Transcript_23350/m.32654 type:complete len:127 (+) Transcript_23350:131-511(+)